MPEPFFKSFFAEDSLTRVGTGGVKEVSSKLVGHLQQKFAPHQLPPQ